MGFVHRFRDTLKPIGFSISCFALISSIFVITYTLVDYRVYVKNFYSSQTQETISLREKGEATLHHLGKLLALLESRIGDARGDVKRIQRVLGSVHRLQDGQGLPEFQKVVFYKLSPPSMKITRFGELTLETNPVMNPMPRKPIFNVDAKNVVGRIGILGVEGTEEGILEIHIPLLAFWKVLGRFETIDLDPTYVENNRAIPSSVNDIFDHLKEKMPQSFWGYASTHASLYAGLFLYGTFSLLGLGFCLYSLDGYFQRNYRKKGMMLEKALGQSEEREAALKETLRIRQHETQSHQSSCQAQKKLQGDVKLKREEYANHLVHSLDILQQSFTDSFSSLSEADRATIVSLCLRQAKALSMGLWEPSHQKEDVDLSALLQRAPLIFAERIQASNIELDINIDPHLIIPLQNERVFIEVLLINAIGKAIYRVPKGGKVRVSLKKEKGTLILEIQDNGYILSGTKASLMKNAFDFFIEDTPYQQLCQDNHIVYNVSKGNGMNVTSIIFPTSPHSYETIAHSNVVPLFR